MKKKNLIQRIKRNANYEMEKGKREWTKVIKGGYVDESQVADPAAYGKSSQISVWRCSSHDVAAVTLFPSKILVVLICLTLHCHLPTTWDEYEVGQGHSTAWWYRCKFFLQQIDSTRIAVVCL